MLCATWRAAPLFTATAVLSLALGIGANTAIYSFMDAILLRGLPVPHPEELVIAEWHAPRRSAVVKGINGSNRRYAKGGFASPNFPYAAYENLRSEKETFSTLFAYTYTQKFNVITGGEAESVPGGFVSGNYFSGLRVPPAAGRAIGDEDDRSGAPPVTMLTYAYWQRHFNGSPATIGESILINNLPFTVIGVSAPGFFGVDPQANPALFLPIHAMPTLAPKPAEEERLRFFDEHFYWIEMMGRLRPGTGVEQAEAVMRARFRAFAAGTAATPKDAEVLPELILSEGASGLDTLRRQYSKPLYVLMIMVGLILAIACANLANLLLARAAARRREIAVRLSLGASRGRIVRQMLTESVLLAVAGGALGLGVAFAGIRFITWLLANGREQFTLRAEINWPVLGFTFALSLLAGVLFGLAPAIQATNVDFTPALKESRLQGWNAPGRRFRPRLGQALIALQIAVSLLLVTGAGLFVRTLSNLHRIDVGFNRENILLVNINGRQGGYREAALARFYSGLLDRFREIPGVRSASASNFPLVSQYVNSDSVTVPGRTPQPGDPGANFLHVDPAFLDTMEIPVLLGRDLKPADLASPTAAVVNQKFAVDLFWRRQPDRPPIWDRQKREPAAGDRRGREGGSLQFAAGGEPAGGVPALQPEPGGAEPAFLRNSYGGPAVERGGGGPAASYTRPARASRSGRSPTQAQRIEPDDFPGTHLCGTGELLCGARAVDRVRGAIWRNGVQRVAAHRRDRDPHRTGRAKAGHHLYGAAGGADHNVRRAAAGLWGDASDHAVRRVFSVSHAAERFAGDRRGDRDPDGRCPGGGLRSRAESIAHRSCQRAAQRMSTPEAERLCST